MTIAPTTFMSVMNKTFQLHLDQFMIVFINEILIYTSNWKEHKKHIRVVLQILRGEQLYAKFRKCGFWMGELQFLNILYLAKE